MQRRPAGLPGLYPPKTLSVVAAGGEVLISLATTRRRTYSARRVLRACLYERSVNRRRA